MDPVLRVNLQNAVLALGAAARLTRLVVADEIGQWWVKDPIDAAAQRWYERETTKVESRRNALRRMGHGEDLVLDRVPDLEQPWWWKYRSGLDCPFCVGFWIGVGVLATRKVPGWKFAASALTLNYVAAHVGVRLGDVTPDADEE